MARIVKSGLIQLSLAKTEGEGTIPEIMEAMLQKHIPYIEEAGRQGVQILCFQEIFNTPYFCPGQDSAWYASAETVFFKPENLGYPVFQTKYAKVGVYICYDRHFPDGARCLGLNGAEIVYNPSATTVGQSQYLWKLEQPAHAVANGYFMGCINRVGEEKPWNLGRFYGTSYFVNPLGQIIACASEDKDELLVTEFDLDLIDQVRGKWQFYRDRRPETYGEITAP